MNYGLVASVMGIIVGVVCFVFAIQSQREKKPTWCVQERQLVGAAVTAYEPLQLLYNGEAVERVSVSEFWLWNAGREAIRREDVADRDRLRVEVSDETRLLGAEVVGVSREVCSVVVGPISKDRRLLPIWFEFLNHGDGVRLRVMHTGTGDGSAEIRGTLIGSRPLRRVPSSRLRYTVAELVLPFAMAIGCACAGFLLQAHAGDSGAPAAAVRYSVFYYMCAVGYGAGLLAQARVWMKPRPPKALSGHS